MSCQRSMACGVLTLISVSPGASCRAGPLMFAYRPADPYEGLAGRPVAARRLFDRANNRPYAPAYGISVAYARRSIAGIVRCPAPPTATLRPVQYQSPGDRQFARGGFCGHGTRLPDQFADLSSTNTRTHTPWAGWDFDYRQLASFLPVAS